MTLSIHETTGWSQERLAPYGRDITTAMKRLEERFPKDVDMFVLFDEILEGKRQLWLILEGDVFKSFLLTRIEENKATNRRFMVATDLAGEGGVDLCELVPDIEKRADELGLEEVVFVGRPGWAKALKKQGYAPAVMTYRKTLEEAA